MHLPLVLQLRDVSKAYRGAVPIPILTGANLDVARGESIAITGPSGCGKSTVLNLIGTLDVPDSGSLTLEGQEMVGLNGDELAALRSTKLGFIFQHHHLLPQCSIYENVLLPTLALRSGMISDAPERAVKLLQRVGLGDRMDHLPGMLSGGERQRAAVVRALINRPLLVLADEPTGSLDRTSAAGVTKLLVELNQEEGVTLIVVTHSLELAKQMRRRLTILDGQLIAASPSSPE
jgi:lipoprotein-releasing system ATP-binding protein